MIRMYVLKKVILICLILITITVILWIYLSDFDDKLLPEASFVPLEKVSSIKEHSSLTEFTDFVSWMKGYRYSESIIDIYKCNYRDPALKLIIKEYFRIKRGDLKWPADSLTGYMKFKSVNSLGLNFIEVIPTDKGAQFHMVDPDILKKFNKYLNERFGKDIVVNHKKVELNYNEIFGDIFYSYKSLFEPEINPRLAAFMKKFDTPCILKFDAEFINNKTVAGIWNIRRCAIIMGRDFRLVDDISIFDKYAHEFGHNIGLVHQFLDPRNPPRSSVDWEMIHKNRGRYVGIDDIMIKSKDAENEAFGHYLSPLSRYALEPVNGYKDNDEFGIVYNSLYSHKVLERVRECACGGY